MASGYKNPFEDLFNAGYWRHMENLRNSQSTQNAQQAANAEKVRNSFNNTAGPAQKVKPRPNFQTAGEMLNALGQVKHQIPKAKKPLTKAERIKEIDDELDICRGRRPTPKGYTINPARVKALMTERRNLEKT